MWIVVSVVVFGLIETYFFANLFLTEGSCTSGDHDYSFLSEDTFL